MIELTQNFGAKEYREKNKEKLKEQIQKLKF